MNQNDEIARLRGEIRKIRDRIAALRGQLEPTRGAARAMGATQAVAMRAGTKTPSRKELATTAPL